MTSRDSKGRFVSGHNVKSPGRPTREHDAKYLKALSSNVSDQDWLEIIEACIKHAKRGDWRARQWLSDYLVGKPVQAVDIDTTNKVLEVVYMNDWRTPHTEPAGTING